MGKRIGKPQTPTKAGYSDVFDIRQHQKYVKDNILANPKDDATGSLRFSGTQYLTRTPSSAGNSLTWTYSTWVRKDAFVSGNYSGWGISAGASGAARTEMDFMASNATTTANRYKVRIGFNPDGTAWSESLTDLVIRDLNSWYHFVVVADMTQATSTDRLKFYVNGQKQTFASYNIPAQNTSLVVNSAVTHYIGTYSGVSSNPTDATYIYKGYLSHITMVDGQALDPTYFGYTDRETGQWKPKRYTGAFGTNGFHLPVSGDFKTGYVRAGIDDYDNNNLENNKADIYSVSAATFTSVWKAHEGKWGKSSWGNNHGKIELTADTAYDLKDVSATPFTIEGWTKFVEEDGVYTFFVSFGTSDFNAWSVWYNGNSNRFDITVDTTGSGGWDIDSGISLDPYDGEWHHWAFTRNTSGQYKFHFDGEYKGIIATSTSDIVTNNNTVKIFSHYDDSTQGNSGYQAPFVYNDSIRMIKGQDLYGTSDIAGWSADIWNIASTKETYVGSGTDLTGTVSFLLPPNRYDAPFKEISGKNNNFRIEGHRSYDGLKDSPQNTFATFLPLNGVTSLELTEGDLKNTNVTGGGTGYQNTTVSSFAIPKSGKWYYEFLVDHVSGSVASAFVGLKGVIPTNGNSGSSHVYYYATGLYHSGTSQLTVIGTADLDVIGFMVDMDVNEFHVYRNGVPNGSIVFPHTDDDLYSWLASGGSGENITYYLNHGQDHTFAGTKTALAKPYTDANGIGEFYYPPPDGALALCTKNIEGGLSNITTTKKYYNRDETGKVLSYSGYNEYTYGTINDERFNTDNPYGEVGSHKFGNDDYIIVPASSDFNFGTGDFTVEGWYKSVGYDNYFPLMNNWRSTTNGGWELYLSGGTTLITYIRDGSNKTSTHQTSMAPGRWYHLAMVRNSGIITTYVDGVPGTSTINGTGVSLGFSDKINYIGVQASNLQGEAAGLMYDIRVVKGTAVYTGTFTPPSGKLTTTGGTYSSTTNVNTSITAGHTVFLTQPYKEETVNNTTPRYTRDETGKIQIFERLRAGTSGSLPMLADMSPYADNSVKSLYFDGYNNVAYKEYSLTDFQPGTGAFTFECWLYLDNVSNNDYHTIFDNRDVSSTDTDSFFFGLRGSVSPAGLLYFYSGGNYLFGSSQIVENNTWHHVALVRTSTSSGGLQCYLDGVGGTAETVANDFTNTNNAETYLGALCDSDAYNFYGYMSDIRFVKGTAVYTGNFTPPSGKLTTTGGTYPSTTNVNTSIPAGHTTLLVQPYSQPAQIHDVSSTYRTNRIYLTDETGNNLTYV